MSKPLKISIIVPVYNAEKYLDRCIDSALKSLKTSGFKGEILLINNNSSDRSLNIMKKFKSQNESSIEIFNCEAQGPGSVRNFGVKKARGEYLWFIDADDSISKDAVEKLIRRAESSEADLVMMGAERIYPDKHRDYLPAIDDNNKNYKSLFVRYGMGPWQVLIRRKWWKTNNFSFREGVIHEDMELMSALILYTDNFAAVNEPLYYYWQNSGSVLHKKEFSPRIFDIFPNLESLYQKFIAKAAEKTYHDELEYFFIWNLLIDSAKDFAKFPEGKPGFKRSREMLKKYFPNWRKNKFLRQKPLKLQLLVRLNYHK